MNQTLGEYYQGKPELLQAMLNDMEENYNELSEDLTHAQARIAELEAALEGLLSDIDHYAPALPSTTALSNARAALKGETR